MPKLQIIRPQSMVPGASADFGTGGAVNSVLGGISQGIGSIGRTVQDLRAQQERAREQLEHNEAVSYVTNTESQADIDWRERLTSEQMGDAAGMTERTLKGFDEYAKEKSAAAPGEKARRMLDTKFQVMRSRLHADAFKFEIGARTTAMLQADDAGTEADARMLLGDPSRFSEAVDRRNVGILAMAIPDADKTKRLRAVQDRLVMAAATGYAQQHPAETLAALGASIPTPASLPATDGGSMSRGAIEESIRIMELEANDPQFDAPTRAATQREADRLKKQLVGVPAAETPAKVEAADHPALGLLPFDRVDDVVRIARATLEGNVASLRVGLRDKARDVQAAVASGVPVGAKDVDGLASQYVLAYGTVEGARRYQDEIGVPLMIGESLSRLRMGNPQERSALIAATKATAVDGAADKKMAFDALVQANSIIERQLKEDPATYVAQSPRVSESLRAMQSVAPEDRSAAVSSYANATLAEQERLGAPKPRLLTGAQSDAVVKAFSDSPPERAADVVSGLEAEWGKHWPMVYRQLAEENKLTPAALVIPNMKDQGSRARLASASALKPDELKALVPSGDAKDIREKLQNNFEPAVRTMMAQSVGGHQSAATILDQAERLAIVYRARGSSVGDAAKQAYDETMGWRYEFAATYRVPREQQPELVTRGATWALSEIGRIALFDSPYPMGADNRARQSLDALKTNGFWVTNEDETGLVLKIKGRDNSDYTAFKADGRRVEYKWLELQRLAGDAAESDRRMVEAGKKLPLTMDQKRQQAEEEARQERLRAMGMR